MPSANPFYEIMGGYYPGSPIPRRKKSPGKPVQPAEFGSGSAILTEYMASIEKDLGNANIPKKIKKLFMDDVARQLQATAGPQNKSYNVDRALELGDQEELAGVQLELNLNPFDWLSDPKGTLEKLAKNTVTSFVNSTDMITHDEQVDIWNKLLKGESASWVVQKLIEPTLGDTSPRGRATTPFKLVDLGVYTDKKDTVIVAPKIIKGGIGKGKEKLELTTPDGKTLPVTSKVDLFEGVASKYKDFTRSVKSSGPRDSKFRDLVNQMGIASASELQDLKIKNKLGSLDQAGSRAVDNFIDEAKIVRLANYAAGRTDSAKYVFADGTEWMGMGAGPEMLSGELSKFIMGTSRDKANEFGEIVPNQHLGSLKGAVGRVRGKCKFDDNNNLIEATGLLGVKGHLQELRKQYVTRNGAAGGARFDRITKDLNQYLDKMLGPSGDGSSGVLKQLDGMLEGVTKLEIKNADGTITEKIVLAAGFSEKNAVQQARNLKGILDYNVKGFKSEGAIKSGLDKLSTNFVREALDNEDLLAAVNGNAEIIGTRNTLNLAAIGLNTYRTEDITDLINKLEKDGGASSVVIDYLWNRARARIETYTPAQYVRQYLEERHYFGLVYNQQYAKDSGIEGELYDRGSRLTNYMVEKSPLKNLFVNKQSLKVAGLNGDVALNFVGNMNLKIGLDLFSKTVPRVGTTPMSMEDLINVINLNTSAFGLKPNGVFVGFEDYSFVQGFDRGWEDLVKRSEDFRAWLRQYGENSLGIKFTGNNLLENTPENQQLLSNLLAALKARDADPNYTSIFSDKAGLLQKVSSKLNILQQKVFGSRFGKLLKFGFTPGSYLKNELKKKLLRGAMSKAIRVITRVIMKILGFVATDLSGGLALVVWGAVEFVVQWVVDKVIDAGARILKAIKDVDFSIIPEFIDTSFGWVFKVSAFVVLIASLFLIMPTTLTMTTIIASITPVDSTRMTFRSDVSLTPGGLPAGPTSLCHTNNTRGGPNCFVIDEAEWPTAAYQVIKKAADYIADNFGGFTSKLCATGDVEIRWDPSVACGLSSEGTVYFGDGQCYLYQPGNVGSENIFTWLLAHELGHTYDVRENSKWIDDGVLTGEFEQSFGEAVQNDCGLTNPTYVGGSAGAAQCGTNNIYSEDVAETIANYIALHRDCGTNIPDCNAYWNTDWIQPGCTLQNHLNWVQTQVFN